jgi:riboflavin biosynthesis protein RibD
MVGCIIVNQETIVGQGFHQKAGDYHAEVIALHEAKDKAIGATAYITLEPCCHYGRTPPCATALIQAGIKKVIFACLDPNPLVAGKGLQELKNAGIEVECGLMQKEALALNEIFFHYIRTNKPFVIAKWAMSLDGKTVTHSDDSPNISSQASREYSHQIRQQVDAILIGSKTAVQDNPQLTVRFPDDGRDFKQPLRIVLSSRGDLPLDLKLFDSPEESRSEKVRREDIRHSGKVRRCEERIVRRGNPGFDFNKSADVSESNVKAWIAASHNALLATTDLRGTTNHPKTIVITTSRASKNWIESLQTKNIEVVVLPENKNSTIDLHHVLNYLGKKQITSLLVEGGMTVLQEFFYENLVNKVHVYLAPTIIGSLNKKRQLTNVNLKNINQDFFIVADNEGNT